MNYGRKRKCMKKKKNSPNEYTNEAVAAGVTHG